MGPAGPGKPEERKHSEGEPDEDGEGDEEGEAGGEVSGSGRLPVTSGLGSAHSLPPS